MQRSKTRVWTEGRHRPAVSTSSIYSRPFGLLTSAIATPGSSSPTTDANRGERSCLGLIVGICSRIGRDFLHRGPGWLALDHFIPAPPSKFTIATVQKIKPTRPSARGISEILARSHVDVELRLTNGAEENVKLLNDPTSGIKIGIAQGGISDSDRSPDLLSLGRINYQIIGSFTVRLRR